MSVDVKSFSQDEVSVTLSLGDAMKLLESATAKPTKRVDQRERRKRMAEYADSHTIHETAQQFNVALSTIRSACEEYRFGGYMSNADRRKRQSEVVEFCRVNSIEQAADKFGLSEEYIRTLCLTRRVRPRSERPSQVPIPKVSSFSILKHLIDGTTDLSAIASKFGVTKQRVCQIRKAAIEAGFDFVSGNDPWKGTD